MGWIELHGDRRFENYAWSKRTVCRREKQKDSNKDGKDFPSYIHIYETRSLTINLYFCLWTLKAREKFLLLESYSYLFSLEAQ